MPTEIREAGFSDIPELVEIWAGFMEELETLVVNENPAMKECEEKDSKMTDSYREFMKSKIESTDGKVFVARKNDKIVGYTMVFIKDEIPIFRNKKTGFVSDLFVKKEFRNKGIGAMLVEKAFEWFRQKGMKFVSLPVYADNAPARSFYRKLGFFDYKVEMRKSL